MTLPFASNKAAGLVVPIPIFPLTLTDNPLIDVPDCNAPNPLVVKAAKLVPILQSPISVSAEKEYPGAAADPSPASNCPEDKVRLPPKVEVELVVRIPEILVVPTTSKLCEA